MKVNHIYDLHVHGGPEPIPRKFDFISLSSEMDRGGIEGFVAKSHFYPTVPFASLADHFGAKTIWGSITLNHFVGGINPNAVRGSLGLKRGDEKLLRIVWLPTIHAESNLNMMKKRGINFDIPPEWSNGVVAAGRQNIEKIVPINIMNEDLRNPLIELLELIAVEDLCLATGHISKEEVFFLIPLAKKIGVKNIIVTHPMYSATELTVQDMEALKKYDNVYFELSYGLIPIDGFTMKEISDIIKELGPSKIILTTDLGQPTQFSPAEGMFYYLNQLSDLGISDEWLQVMASDNPRKAINLY